MVIILIFFLIIFTSPAGADIFVPSAVNNGTLKDDLAKDRAGYYYYSPGVDLRSSEKAASELDSFAVSSLKRDSVLYDMDASFNRYFEESFFQAASFDKYRVSRNSLLLLSYASPGLADVIKHYRSLAMQRLALEQGRLADIERTTESPLDRLRLLSERECLRDHQGDGLVKAMAVCKKAAEPFDALRLINGQGSLSDGRRNIHVVRDAVARLATVEKGAPDKTAALSGEVVVSDDTYTEVLPKDTLASRTEYYRQKFARKWQEALSDADNATLNDLSLPGVPLTRVSLKSMTLLDPPARAAVIAKLSACLARAEAMRDYYEALVYLENAQKLPDLPQAFKVILSVKSERLFTEMARAESALAISEGYRAMLSSLMSDADTARASLLAAQDQGRSVAYEGDLFKLSF